MPYTSRRDFVGYGANPPDPKWPNGARLAVNFVMNYEEGSEPSVQDGEGHTETGLTEAHGMGQTSQGRDLAAEGMFEYGSRVGFWRLMRLFEERGAAADGVRLRARPGAQSARPPRPSAKPGYDVCSHGWRWIKHYELTEAEEREHIRQAVASHREDDRRAAARLVLPLRTQREHAPPGRRGGRLPLRLRRLQRRAAVLGDGRRQGRTWSCRTR